RFRGTDDTRRVAEQFADGFPDARHSEALERSLEFARGGENRIREIRRFVIEGERETGPGVERYGESRRALPRHHEETARRGRIPHKPAAALAGIVIADGGRRPVAASLCEAPG